MEDSNQQSFGGDMGTNNHQRQAAEAIIRGELDQIYNQADDNQPVGGVLVDEVLSQTSSAQPDQIAKQETKPTDTLKSSQTQPESATTVPETYQQNYHVNDPSSMNQNIDWQKYHSAWQDYYQKYYEYYFRQSAAATQAEAVKYASAAQEKFQSELAVKNDQVNKLTAKLETTGNFNPQDEALDDLKAKLRAKMIGSAKKVRKSNHFWPIATTLAVLLIFLFLQYNQLIMGNVMAYVRPGNVSPRTIVVNPTTSIEVGPEPLLIIPKINVEVPVVYDIPNDHNSTFDAMREGVAQFAIPGASAHPGEVGNTVITGHSSNDVFDRGSYKFIFGQLDKLEKGDIIYANYKGVRYTYSVTRSEVVWPNEVGKVVVPATKPIMTLITCTPLGTARQRLLVFAEQIAPDPDKASQPQASAPETKEVNLPGQTKGFFERIFGL